MKEEANETPREFLPRPKDTSADHEDEELTLFDWLEEDGDMGASSRCDDPTLERITISGKEGDVSVPLQFQVRLPPDKATLFAHRVWSGSKLLASFLRSNRTFVRDKLTIELGAGTALPSLVALACHSRGSVLTDYPDDNLLQALRETVGLNWVSCHRPLNRVAVVGHAWGSSVEEIQRAAVNMLRRKDDETTIYFDTVLLSECLWMHRSHKDLARSIDRLLHPERGFVVITYAHHVPGCEAADDAFFDICSKDYRLSTIHQETREADYMWCADKTIEVHLRVLSRRT